MSAAPPLLKDEQIAVEAGGRIQIEDSLGDSTAHRECPAGTMNQDIVGGVLELTNEDLRVSLRYRYDYPYGGVCFTLKLDTDLDHVEDFSLIVGQHVRSNYSREGNIVTDSVQIPLSQIGNPRRLGVVIFLGTAQHEYDDRIPDTGWAVLSR